MTNWMNEREEIVMDVARRDKVPLESLNMTRQYLQAREDPDLSRNAEADLLYRARLIEAEEKQGILRMAAQQSYDWGQTKHGCEEKATDLLRRAEKVTDRLERRELTTAEGAAEIASIRQELAAVNVQLESLAGQAVSMEAIVADPFAYAERLYRVYPALADRRKRLT